MERPEEDLFEILDIDGTVAFSETKKGFITLIVYERDLLSSIVLRIGARRGRVTSMACMTRSAAVTASFFLQAVLEAVDL